MVRKDFIIGDTGDATICFTKGEGNSIEIFYEDDETIGNVKLEGRNEVNALIEELKLLSKNMK